MTVAHVLAVVATGLPGNGNWEFRFPTPGVTSGVLQVRPNATAPWGIVCDTFFNKVAAKAACRSLGLPSGGAFIGPLSATALAEANVSNTTLIYMDTVSCGGIGGEPYLPQCTFRFSDAGTTTHNCHFTEAVNVSCADWNGQVSLVGGTTPYDGLLRVRPDTNSDWGIVCDDYFGAAEAQAACRSVFNTTFPDAAAKTSTDAQRLGYAAAFTTIYMDDVSCGGSGTDPYLHQCSFLYSQAEFTTHNCYFTEAVYVSCQGLSWQVSLAGGTPNEGLLRVRPDTSSDWGVVCDDYFGVLEAQAACRSIFGSNFSAAASQTSTAAQRLGYATASTTIYMDDVACTSGQRLPECTFIESTPTARRNDCDVSEAVYLICTAPATTGASIPTTAAPTPTTGASTPTTGAPTSTTAALTPTTSAPTPTTSAPTPTTGAPTPTTAAPTTGAPTTMPSERWQVSLAGGTTAYNGLLRVRPDTSSDWGIVCDDGFGVYEAHAACRSIFGANFYDASAQTSTEAQRLGFATYNTTIYMDDVRCTGGQRLPDCTFIESTPTNRRHDCAVWEAVFLICTPFSTVSTAGGSNSATTATTAATATTSAPTPTTGAPTTTSNSTNTATTGAPTVTTAAPTTGAPTTMPSERWQVSLAGGTTAYNGLLRVRPDASSDWGIVCDDYFGVLEAQAACRSIFNTTFPDAIGQTSTAAQRVGYATASTTIYMDDVFCTSGQRLSDCAFTESTPTVRRHNCEVWEAVYLICTSLPTTTATVMTGSTAGAPTPPSSTLPPPTSTLFATNLPTGNGNWQFRFPTASATGGILQVRPNATAPWGIVCHDYFDTTAAQAACRSLGLPTAGATFSQPTSTDVALAGVSGATPIYMDDILCSGSEPYLPQCSYRIYHDCSYLDAVAVSCGSTPPPPGGPGTWQLLLKANSETTFFEGLLLVRPASTAGWGLVCDDGFGALEAQAACRFIYKETFTFASAATSTAAQRQRFWNADAATIYMDDVRCSSGQTLPQCTFIESTPTITRHNCSVNRAVYLYCNEWTTSSPTMPSERWQVSLAGGTTAYEGLLRVRPNVNADWGIVCDDDFGALEAQAACRSILGTTFPDAIGQTSTAAQRQGYATLSTTIYMDDVRCTGGQRLPDCTFIESTPTERRHDCAVSEAVYLICTNPTTTAPPTPWPGGTNGQWRFQLGSEHANPTSGILQARPNSTAPWGFVCIDRFTTAAAQAACRSLGLPSAFADYRYAQTSEWRISGLSTKALIYMDDVNCDGAGPDAHLPQCGYRFSDAGTTTHDCAYYEAVFLTCTDTRRPKTTWEVSLAGGLTANDGLLLVRPDSGSSWGLVCPHQFGVAEAQAACLSIFGKAHPWSTAQESTAAQRARAGYEAGLIRLDYVWCVGTANPFLHECLGSRSLPPFNCGVGNTLYLTCSRQRTIEPPYSSYVSIPEGRNQQWEFQLQAAGATSGVLRARPNATSPWGIVCRDVFDATVAQAACRSLGLSAEGSSCSEVHPQIVLDAGVSSETPIYMNNLYCGGLDLPFLPECTFTPPDPNSFMSAFLTEALFVSCGANPSNNTMGATSAASTSTASNTGSTATNTGVTGVPSNIFTSAQGGSQSSGGNTGPSTAANHTPLPPSMTTSATLPTPAEGGAARDAAASGRAETSSGGGGLNTTVLIIIAVVSGLIVVAIAVAVARRFLRKRRVLKVVGNRANSNTVPTTISSQSEDGIDFDVASQASSIGEDVGVDNLLKVDIGITQEMTVVNPLTITHLTSQSQDEIDFDVVCEAISSVEQIE